MCRRTFDISSDLLHNHSECYITADVEAFDASMLQGRDVYSLDLGPDDHSWLLKNLAVPYDQRAGHDEIMVESILKQMSDARCRDPFWPGGRTEAASGRASANDHS